MTRYRTDWLPYGSDDEDVVLRHSLTTAPSAAEMGYSTRTIVGNAGGPTHDPVLGMRAFNIAAAASSAYRFDTASAALQACEQEGQLSFEIEAKWIAAVAANLSESAGDVTGAFEAPFLFTSNSGTNNPFCLGKVSNGAISFRFGAGTDSSQIPFIGGERLATANAFPLVHSVGKSRFVRVNFAWWGGLTGGDACIAIDDFLCSRVVRVATGSTANLLNRLFFGCENGSNFVPNHYMRNWQIAKRAPVFPVNKGIGRVGAQSDSILDFMNTFSASLYGEAMINCSALRYLQQQGIRIDGWGEQELGGGTVHNSGGIQFASTRAAVLAIRPDTVIIMGGTNDLPDAAFTTDYQDHINFFMGVGAYAASQIRAQRVLLCTIPEGPTSLAGGNTLALNTAIRALPAWWNGAQPALAGRISIIDVHTALHGGAVPRGTNWYVDGVHLNSKGNYKVGTVIGKALLAFA